MLIPLPVARLSWRPLWIALELWVGVIAFVAWVLMASSCSMLPVTSGHPALAMNPAICGPLGVAIGDALGGSGYTAALDAMMISLAGCSAESSLVNGPPATTTTTTTQTTAATHS